MTFAGSKVFHAVAGLILAILGLPLWLGCATAQDQYPSRQITLLVPYPAGGFIDVTARVLAEGLREKLHQSVVVMNKPGANGKVALGELVRSAADGYTLLVNNDGGIGIPPAVDGQFRFDYQKDYTPVAQFADGKYLLTVRGTLPVKTTAELIAYAKSNPGKVTFGSPGIATSPHMAMEILMRRTGTKMVHVPYLGAAPATTDLLKGVIDVLVNSMPAVRGYIGSDSVRILAVFDEKRHPLIPNVPTLKESGVASIPVGGWVGVFGPADMPKPVLQTLNTAIKSVLDDPTNAKRLTDVGADASFKGIEEFPAFYRSEVEKWKKFSDETGVKLAK
ncbi:MAG TPA: tripartite tricarboxylate transporter substrate binding protein [Xanthobacteraceae bacterium]|nr:tripartite tricarboxylate transporter substrate binding protein [Xanthobacteraceae bacterium]